LILPLRGDYGREKKKERRLTKREFEKMEAYYDMRFSFLMVQEVENDRRVRNKAIRLSRKRKVDFYV